MKQTTKTQEDRYQVALSLLQSVEWFQDRPSHIKRLWKDYNPLRKYLVDGRLVTIHSYHELDDSCSLDRVEMWAFFNEGKGSDEHSCLITGIPPANLIDMGIDDEQVEHVLKLASEGFFQTTTGYEDFDEDQEFGRAIRQRLAEIE